jgi:hypothetical protein
MDSKDEELLDFAHFVATKFESSRNGWKYSRDLGDLKYIRYEHDYTGHNSFKERLKRATNLKRLFGVGLFESSLFGNFKRSPKQIVTRAYIRAVIALRKRQYKPDGQINGNLIHWEEDGEYMALFQPRVGVKVIEFIRANPDNPYAQEIMKEIRACAALSWSEDEEASDDEADEA